MKSQRNYWETDPDPYDPPAQVQVRDAATDEVLKRRLREALDLLRTLRQQTRPRL